MPEPAVVDAMREFKQALLAREMAQMQEMAGRWVQVEQALSGELAALTEQAARLREAGESLTEARVYRMRRYRRLLGQAQEEAARYTDYADQTITRGQEEVAAWGIDHASRSIQLSYAPRVGVYFDRLPVEAVEHLVGLATDGGPVRDLLRRRLVRDENGRPLPGVLERLTRTLINGTAQGWNPRKTAREMRDDLTGGLQQALTIARSEQMRVYRQAGLDQYRASGVVEGQKRLATHDGRTCAACLADEGNRYPLDAVISDHPNGRCTGVPIVSGMPEVRWLSGEAWFRAQPEEVQRQILHDGRFEAWQEGAFSFQALATHTQDPTWGAGLKPTPLNQLVG